MNNVYDIFTGKQLVSNSELDDAPLSPADLEVRARAQALLEIMEKNDLPANEATTYLSQE